MWHESKAKIIYDPNRPGMKRRTEWWCIALVDKEITRYYRWWVQRMYHIQMDPPSWNAHISIIRGERPHKNQMSHWKKYHGKVVTFKYEHNPCRSNRDDYWTVEVQCDELMRIREEFGFPTHWPLHLSIGKEKY